MGVPGLWDLLRPAAARATLATLSREAVTSNKNGLRALTIGIDASIWIFHAQVPQHGENPFLRTIFFKITSLLQQPVLPVFVFDGPQKPTMKRGRSVAGRFGTSDLRSTQFKELLDECGLEWWNAPGEAEAELAVMNRQGKIDAVLSDDVDALLFGAVCLINNNSPTLTQATAKSAADTTEDSALVAGGNKIGLRPYEIYRPAAILRHWTQDGSALQTEEDCRMAMIWTALLAGGDYNPEGISQIGPTIAMGLAHAGFAKSLQQYMEDEAAFMANLADLHARATEEVRTDAAGLIGRRNPAKAQGLGAIDPATLLPRVALDAYLRPATSPLGDPSHGWPGFGKGMHSTRRGKARNSGRGDLEGFARACERYFEWGTVDEVVKRFGSDSLGLYHAEIVNKCREAIRQTDAQDQARYEPELASLASAQPSTSTLCASKISDHFPSIRPTTLNASQDKSSVHSTNDEPVSLVGPICKVKPDLSDSQHNMYRLEYAHEPFSSRCRAAMHGHRRHPRDLSVEERAALGLVEVEKEKQPSKPKSILRAWFPDYLINGAFPELIEDWQNILAGQLEKKEQVTEKAKKKAETKKALDKAAQGMDASAFIHFFQPTQHTAIAVVEPAIDESVVDEPATDEASSSASADDDWVPPPTNVVVVDTPKTPKTAKAPKKTTADVEVQIIDLSESPDSSSSQPTSPLTPVLDLLEKRKTRHEPSSSLSSISSLPVDRSSSPANPPPPRMAAHNPKRAIRVRSTARTTRTTRKTTLSALPKVSTRRTLELEVLVPIGSRAEPISLCSSDEETPKASRTIESVTPVIALSPSTRSNAKSSDVLVGEKDAAGGRRQKSPKKKAKPFKASESDVQQRLDFPVLAWPGSSSSQSSKLSSSPIMKTKPRKAKYVVVSESDDGEAQEFDCTRSH